MAPNLANRNTISNVLPNRDNSRDNIINILTQENSRQLSTFRARQSRTNSTHNAAITQIPRIINRGEALTPVRILQRIQNNAIRAAVNTSTHPQFRNKKVYVLNCKHCSALLFWRGMKAILLGDSNVELYSTDNPSNLVQTVYSDYMTPTCLCKICDAACLNCGSIVGYNVTTPCLSCMSSCNNGHFWMFLAEDVKVSSRAFNKKSMHWETLPTIQFDQSFYNSRLENIPRR